jgi:trigger factor
MPEINLGNYKGLKAKQKPSAVLEGEVESFIENLRQRQAAFHPVSDRAVKSGDLVQIDSKARLEDSEFSTFSKEGLTVLLGAGQIHETFDEQILGLSLENNKKFKVAFPKEYKMPEIADKEIEFDVTIKKISEKKLPNLDDDFAQKVGGASLEEFKKEIQTALENRKKTESEEVLKNDLIDQIEIETKVEIPQLLIQREIDTMVSESRRSLETQGLNLDNYLKNTGKSLEDFKSDMKERAVKRVKNKLVLEEIAKREKLLVSDIDLEIELRAIAREGGGDPQQMQKSLAEGVIEYIKDYLLRRKALDFVVANARIEQER